MPLATALDLPVFQGPLDLLLDLVERRRLVITEISLATVADQYLQAVRALSEPDPDLLAEFLVIGARLLLLKSRALLPQPDAVDEDEPLDDLAERLEQYRLFKEAALSLATRFESGSQAFPPPARPDLQALQPELAPIEAELLARLWRSIVRRQPPPVVQPPAPQPRVSVADRLAALRHLLADRDTLLWDEVAGHTLDELIATFLAVLELVRRGELGVRQDLTFGPLLLQARRPAVAVNSHAVGSEPEQLG